MTIPISVQLKVFTSDAAHAAVQLSEDRCSHQVPSAPKPAAVAAPAASRARNAAAKANSEDKWAKREADAKAKAKPRTNRRPIGSKTDEETLAEENSMLRLLLKAQEENKRLADENKRLKAELR